MGVKEPASAGLLQDKLVEAGIPVYLAAGLPLAQTRVGKTLLLFLELLDSDYARPRVMELAAYAPWDFTALLPAGTPPNPALWELLTIEAGLVGGRGKWLPQLEAYQAYLSKRAQAQEAKGAAESDWRGRLAALAQFRDFLESLFAAAGAVPLNGCWSEFTGALADFIRRFASLDEQQALSGCFKAWPPWTVWRLRLAARSAGAAPAHPAGGDPAREVSAVRGQYFTVNRAFRPHISVLFTGGDGQKLSRTAPA